MKKVLMLIVVMMLAFPVSNVLAGDLVVMDFDTGDKPNNLGGDFGAWDKDPNDNTQSCKATFAFGNDAAGKADGYALQLDYDVDSANPAYNGFWAKLEGEDFSQFNTLNIFLKGDAAKGFTKRIKIEMKDFQGSSPFVVSGITDQWQKFQIPFEKFSRIKDWGSMNEIVLVFDDVNSSPKTGTIYVDNISVSKE